MPKYWDMPALALLVAVFNGYFLEMHILFLFHSQHMMVFCFFAETSANLKGHCHENFKKGKNKNHKNLLISDNLQTMIPFRIKVVSK